MPTTRDWICLSLLPGLGPAGFWKLTNHFGSPSKVLRAAPKELTKVGGIRLKQLAGFSSKKECEDRACEQIDRLQSLHGRVLLLDSPDYPEFLRHIPDPPPVLYALGHVDLLKNCCIAVVGSRSATVYGKRIGYSFAERLSASSVTVVSGLAFGIDSEAHRGALQGSGKTVGVLGCGLDVVYPKQNKPLYESVYKEGLLLSEYPLGTQPEGFRFPARNRIIAGLSRAIVVVEAAKKSGSLITAQLGLDFGREIFAVPGQVDSYKSEGTHWLIQQGAQLAVSADDIIADLQPAGTAAQSGGEAGTAACSAGMEPEMALLYGELEPYPQALDDVVERAGLSPARGSELFLFLELEGYIEMLPGDRVRRL